MTVPTFHLKDSKSDSWSERRAAAEQILQSQERIKTIWEAKVRTQIAEVQQTGSAVLVESFGIFLNELASALRQELPSPERFSENAMATIHGASRALFRGYSLSQLLLEFSIVREVLSEELQARGVLTHEVHRIIDKSLDRSISLAAMEFERIQNKNLNAVLDQTESSNRDLEQLAFVAAHDLNSPLATISSLMDLLLEEMGPHANPKIDEYAQYIKQTLARMSSLIRNLLEYARITQKKRPFQRILLDEVLNASMLNLKETIEKSQAKISHVPLPSVSGDPDLLIQVFPNLLANAIKYRSAQTPLIHIDCQEKDPENWLVVVKDNGIGFNATEKEEIFSLYKRIEDNSNVPGVGIGLATCRKVIELHHGKVWAESAPGQGSAFYFTLPKEDIRDFH